MSLEQSINNSKIWQEEVMGMECHLLSGFTETPFDPLAPELWGPPLVLLRLLTSQSLFSICNINDSEWKQHSFHHAYRVSELKFINVFNSYNNPLSSYFYLHFPDEETEEQRSNMTKICTGTQKRYCHWSSRKCWSQPRQAITSHLSEWLSPQRQEVTSAGKDVEERELLCTRGGNVNWHCHYGKQYGGSSKNEKLNHHMIQQFYFWVFTWREWKHRLKKLHTLACSMKHCLQ